MDKLHKTVKLIKELKIQGAEEVAKAAIKAWSSSPDKRLATSLLKSARPTEPMLRNVLKYLNKEDNAASLIMKIDKDTIKISEYGSRLIDNGSIVYTHCHSSTVESALLHAKKEGKKFTVNITETRPLFQGRITAMHLAKAGIKVKMFVDSAATYAMHDADIMLIGADAVTSYGDIINKVGSHLFAKLANEHGIPVYSLFHSLKFDPATEYGKKEKIEERSPREVWQVKHKNIRIINPAFDVVPSKYIVAAVTEFGVLKPLILINLLQEKYPWMFR